MPAASEASYRLPMRAWLLLVTVCGCSVLHNSDPPTSISLRANVPPLCSRSYAFPVLDVSIGVGYVFAGVSLAGLSVKPGDEKAIIAVVAPAAILHWVSAVWGISKVNECNDVNDEWMRVRAAKWGYREPSNPAILPVPDLPADTEPALPPNDMPGAERGPCRATAPLCAGDLVCVSDRCVRRRP